MPSKWREESVLRRGQRKTHTKPNVLRSRGAVASERLPLPRLPRLWGTGAAGRWKTPRDGECSPIAQTMLRAATCLHTVGCSCCLVTTSSAATVPLSNAAIAPNVAKLSRRNDTTSTRRPWTDAKPWGARHPSRACSRSLSFAHSPSKNQRYAGLARRRNADASALDENMWMEERGCAMMGALGDSNF